MLKLFKSSLRDEEHDEILDCPEFSFRNSDDEDDNDDEDEEIDDIDEIIHQHGEESDDDGFEYHNPMDEDEDSDEPEFGLEGDGYLIDPSDSTY